MFGWNMLQIVVDTCECRRLWQFIHFFPGSCWRCTRQSTSQWTRWTKRKRNKNNVLSFCCRLTLRRSWKKSWEWRLASIPTNRWFLNSCFLHAGTYWFRFYLFVSFTSRDIPNISYWHAHIIIMLYTGISWCMYHLNDRYLEKIAEKYFL